MSVCVVCHWAKANETTPRDWPVTHGIAIGLILGADGWRDAPCCENHRGMVETAIESCGAVMVVVTELEAMRRKS